MLSRRISFEALGSPVVRETELFEGLPIGQRRIGPSEPPPHTTRPPPPKIMQSLLYPSLASFCYKECDAKMTLERTPPNERQPRGRAPIPPEKTTRNHSATPSLPFPKRQWQCCALQMRHLSVVASNPLGLCAPFHIGCGDPDLHGLEMTDREGWAASGLDASEATLVSRGGGVPRSPAEIRLGTTNVFGFLSKA